MYCLYRYSNIIIQFKIRVYKVEVDPEKNELLFTHFVNKPADEEKELYSVPLGKEYYIQQYPTI